MIHGNLDTVSLILYIDLLTIIDRETNYEGYIESSRLVMVKTQEMEMTLRKLKVTGNKTCFLLWN